MATTTNEQYVQREFSKFAGKKILGIRQMNETELDDMMWGDEPHPAIVILCEGGFALIVSQDEEGNGPGALFASKWGVTW